jgi:hypothetical protein
LLWVSTASGFGIVIFGAGFGGRRAGFGGRALFPEVGAADAVATFAVAVSSWCELSLRGLLLFASDSLVAAPEMDEIRAAISSSSA